MYKIYLDGAANTPLDRNVFNKMKKVMPGYFGNSFAIHSFGIRSMKTVEEARSLIAQTLKVQEENIYFTSGATESNNWVLKSLFLNELRKERQHTDYHGKKRIVVSAIEHSSILHCCSDLEKLGAEIVYVYPNRAGRITPSILKKALTDDTLIVAVMAVNNETGVMNPIEALGRLAHQYDSYFLADCTQEISYGGHYVEIGTYLPEVDYMTFSGHKVYGPTGIGCLITGPNTPIYSFISGGAQEQGVRGGTSNVAGIVGLAEALKIIHARDDYKLYKKLYAYLESKIKDLKNIKINFKPDHKNIISLQINIPGLQNIINHNNMALATILDSYGIACSASSACDANGDAEAPLSHVLLASGLKPEIIKNTVRISFMRFTQKRDIDILIDTIHKIEENYGTN